MSGTWGSSNAGWRRKTPAVMRRDGYVCQIHDPGCTVNATEVDHTIPRYLGGTDDMDNLQAVCHSCHWTKTRREGLDARRVKTARMRLPTTPHPGTIHSA